MHSTHKPHLLLTLLFLTIPLSACTTTWPTTAKTPIQIAGGKSTEPQHSTSTSTTDTEANNDHTNTNNITVIHIPGISGIWHTDRNFAYGLQDAGINDIQKFEWTGMIALWNLMDDDLHERKAEALVEKIRNLHANTNQATPPAIVLTAHSGGTRIALLAIEKLVAENPELSQALVDQVWLIAAALDPDYKLTPTLDYVNRFVNIQSTYDSFILGTGTSLFGTADNYYGDSAGKVGFNTTDPRLEVWQYHKSWKKYGATSGHLGVLDRQFAREVVGPAIMHSTPNPLPDDSQP